MEDEEGGGQIRGIRGRHIKKRALKNKTLTVSFDEKDLKDFVTGFHKRKKKRRKEAQVQLEEAWRRKRIEARKKRKEEREFAIFGGAAPDSGAGNDEPDEDLDDEEENEPNATVSGSTTYDNGDVQVIVTTSEISREEEESPAQVPPPSAAAQDAGETKNNKRSIPVTKKKPFKKVAKKRSRPKPQSNHQIQAAVPLQENGNLVVARIKNFMRMNPPEFFGSKAGEDPQLYLDEGLMTVNEYCLKFNQLSMYAPDMMADLRASMSKFVTRVSGLVVKECRTAILIGDMDLTRLMMHAQKIKAEKLKKRDINNKRARTGSQNSVSGRLSYLTGAKWGKNHPGECLEGQKGCFGYVPELVLCFTIPFRSRRIHQMLLLVKVEYQRPSGALQKIDIPTWKWEEVNMDFLTGLPHSHCQHDSIWVIVYRLTKSSYFLPVHKSYTTEDYAKLYIREIVRLYGVSLSIISDRGTQFTSQFWRFFQKGLGTQVHLSSSFYLQTDGQAERTIQTLKDMLRAYALDFKGSWDEHLLLIEFAYNNSHYASIQMALFESLSGQRCRSPFGWFKVGEATLIGLDMVFEAMEKVQLIRERLKEAQSCQKSYVDVRRRDLEFEVDDLVYLKVSLMKRVKRFCKKGKA
ncbi:Zinc ion binding, putative isoform 1 [Capsicum annuum]|nr:Zinc ion binding, putative isoform 1 [Capsicum annuum]